MFSTPVLKNVSTFEYRYSVLGKNIVMGKTTFSCAKANFWRKNEFIFLMNFA